MNTQKNTASISLVHRFLLLALGLSLSSQFVFRAFGQEAGTPIVQTLRVGNSPTGLAFDGGNVWVVNDLDNNVMKLRDADGALLGTFNVGLYPVRAAFDGTNIWVTNFGNDTEGAYKGTVASLKPAPIIRSPYNLA